MAEKTVTIGGQTVVLEERICVCGCFQTFWVTQNSTMKYAGEGCKEKVVAPKSMHWREVHKRKVKGVKDV